MQGRNVQLDLLRCVAIFAVLVCHTVNYRSPQSWWDRLLIRPTWSGVDLFFVLSGFLISGLLFAEFQHRGRINFGRFAIRRALKLYPTLFVLVFGVLFFRLLRSGFQPARWIIAPALHDVLFVQSYWPGTYGHFWSLSVEEHFYVLLPLTLYLMLRKASADGGDPFRKLPLVFLAVAMVTLAVRLIHGIVVPYDYLTHIFPTHLRLDSLLFGVLISYWQRFRRDEFDLWMRRFGTWLLPVSGFLILPAFVLDQSNFFMYTAGFTCLYLGYGGTMIALLRTQLSMQNFPGRLLRPLAWIGQHSYPIYVFHLLILDGLSRSGLMGGVRGTVLYFACAVTGGVLISKVVEYPVLRLRDRIFPREGDALPGLPGIRSAATAGDGAALVAHAEAA